MKQIKDYIGYFLAFVALIGWGVTIGAYKSKIDDMAKNVEELHKMMMEQQQLNGKMIFWMEYSTKNNDE